MKLDISIDLAPSEVDVARDLIALLKQLTEHVRVRQSGASTGSHAQTAAPPQPASNGPLDMWATSRHRERNNFDDGRDEEEDTAHEGHFSRDSAMNFHGNARALAKAGVLQGPPTPLTPEPPQPRQPPPAVKPSDSLESLLQSLDKPDVSDSEVEVRALAGHLAERAQREGVPAAVAALAAAFRGIYLDPTRFRQQRNGRPAVDALKGLPEEFRKPFVGIIVKDVASQLKVEHALDCNYEEFFTVSELFAAQVSVNWVDLQRALGVLVRLAESEKSRRCALATLCKICEYCYDKLGAEVDESVMQKLDAVLHNIQDNSPMRYERDYVRGILFT